jgi:hypothetical protein
MSSPSLQVLEEGLYRGRVLRCLRDKSAQYGGRYIASACGLTALLLQLTSLHQRLSSCRLTDSSIVSLLRITQISLTDAQLQAQCGYDDVLHYGVTSLADPHGILSTDEDVVFNIALNVETDQHRAVNIRAVSLFSCNKD